MELSLFLVPYKEGVGVCLHLPKETVPAAVSKLEREQERNKLRKVGWAIECRWHQSEEGASGSEWGSGLEKESG